MSQRVAGRVWRLEALHARQRRESTPAMQVTVWTDDDGLKHWQCDSLHVITKPYDEAKYVWHGTRLISGASEEEVTQN